MVISVNGEFVKMVAFNSLIILDLETTGLPLYDHSTTKITELSLLGCEVQHIQDPSKWPRVLHKLVLCFNPRKMIQPDASKVSGLNNEILEKAKPFTKEDVEIINHFISRLPSPVCLVAHNGNAFDFPILRRQLEKLKKSLPNDVYCADSLLAFKTIFGNVDTQTRSSSSKCGETTPKNQTTNPRNQLNYKSMDSDDVNKTERFAKKDVCKNLFGETMKKSSEFDEFEINLGQSLIKSFKESPKSYKLKDIYFFLHKYNFTNGHEAEIDCKALLSCIIKCEGFLNWVNENAVSFNAIKPLF